MAKSIRLDSETQHRVIKEIAAFHSKTKVLLPDAKMVKLLVNEAIDAREKVREKKVSR